MLPFNKNLKRLINDGEINDRNCVLQEVIRSASLRNESDPALEKDAISLLHKSGSPGTKHEPTEPLPPSEAVFKELLESKTSNDDHSNGISSFAYAFASLVNLSIRRPSSIHNDVSPYFDLYPLYGGDPSDFDKVRLKDGTGMMSPDTFFDDRLIFLPKASAVLLVLFNRNHNYIARRLLLQMDTLADDMVSADSALSQALSLQDDNIFEKARRINCGHFRNIMLEDVLKPLTGLPVVGSSLQLNFLSASKDARLPLGNGFDSFVEPGLLYDWSGIMSGKDVQQFEDAMRKIVHEDSNKAPLSDFDNAVGNSIPMMDTSKQHRDCAGLKRGETGQFCDSDLAKILYDATECPARGTEWARHLGAGSLNDYRKFLGLKALQSFKEWTSNPAVAASAEKLYKSIDRLEVYVGLQAEDTIKDAMDSGFRFGYTKTYGLLVDIISRIRSDPALTTNFSPENLTSWGFNDCALKPNNGSFGAFMPKLLQRTLPREYEYNNIYGLFPFSVPNYTTPLLPVPIWTPKYITERPQPRKVHHLVTMEAIDHVCNQPKSFPTVYNDNFVAITSGYGYFLGFDDEKRHKQDRMMALYALIPNKGALRRYGAYFANMADECIKEKANSRPGEIDVARDVIIAVCTRWVCEILLDFQVMQTGNGTGTATVQISGSLVWYIWSPLWHWFCKINVVRKLLRQGAFLTGEGKEVRSNVDLAELHEKFASIYAFVFNDLHTEDAWELRETALSTCAALSAHIQSKLPCSGVVSDQSSNSFVNHSITEIQSLVINIIKELTTGTTPPEQPTHTFLGRVLIASRILAPYEDEDIDWSSSPEETSERESARVIANVLGLAVVAAAKYTKVCTQAINFYFQDQYIEERNEIIRLSQLDDERSKKLIMGYIREAYRLDEPLGVWRQVSGHAIIPQGHGLPDISVDAGDRIYADFSQALNNPSAPDLAKVIPGRETMGIQGLGLHKCLGTSFVDHTMPELFKAIFRLENIRRATGRKGSLVRFINPYDTSTKLFLDAEGTSFRLDSYPRSLVLHYDAKAVDATSGDAKGATTESTAHQRENPRIGPGKATENTRAIVVRIASILVIWLIVYLINFIISFLSSTFRSPLSSAPSRPSRSPTAPEACLPPTKPIQPWEIIMMKAGDNGKLIPLEYTLDLPTAHSVSVVDVDAKDMKMAIWLDRTLLGITTDIELNKSENCGDNIADCLNRGFSGGYVVIPKGVHTVRIEWAGVEIPGPDGKIDWGDERGRRLAWNRDACAG